MKISKSILLTALLTFFSSLAFANESEKLTSNNVSEKSEKEVRMRVDFLKDRVSEIQHMQPSTMDQFEKTQVKEELKRIKKELKVAHNEHITISVGGLIIIILLLIIIF